MKKLILLLSIAVIITACGKNEIVRPSNPETIITVKLIAFHNGLDGADRVHAENSDQLDITVSTFDSKPYLLPYLNEVSLLLTNRFENGNVFFENNNDWVAVVQVFQDGEFVRTLNIPANAKAQLLFK